MLYIKTNVVKYIYIYLASFWASIWARRSSLHFRRPSFPVARDPQLHCLDGTLKNAILQTPYEAAAKDPKNGIW